MREHYIANKVKTLFHGKHTCKTMEHCVKHNSGNQDKIVDIVAYMNFEIQKANEEMRYKLNKMLTLCLKEKL